MVEIMKWNASDLLSFQALDESGLLSADVSSGAAMNEDVEVEAGPASVLAQQPAVISLVKILNINNNTYMRWYSPI